MQAFLSLFFFFVCASSGGSWSQAFLVGTVETGDKIATCHSAMLYFVKKALKRLI